MRTRRQIAERVEQARGFNEAKKAPVLAPEEVETLVGALVEVSEEEAQLLEVDGVEIVEVVATPAPPVPVGGYGTTRFFKNGGQG
jgi:hypothetical protein